MSDRLPPTNDQAEQALLGAILLDQKAISEIVSRFPTAREFFYDLKHTAIFDAASDLERAQRPVKIIEVSQLLRDRNQLDQLGGVQYLSSLENASIGASEATYQCELLRDLYIRRRSIQDGVRMQQRGFDEGDVEALVSANLKAATDLADLRQPAIENSMLDLARKTLETLEDAKLAKGKNKMRGLPFGIHGLDRMLGGMRGGQLIVVAARPGDGKTSLAMNAAECCAVENSIPTAVFSLEMSDEALVFRMACSRSRIDSVQARDGELSPFEEKKLAAAMPTIAKAPLHIYPLRSANITTMMAVARRAVAKHGIKLIIVDYLQLLHGSKKAYSNRVAEITEISGAIKSLAMELDVPVLAPAQLNRSNDKEERPPRLSDLRDSGSIEQDADVVVFLHPAKEADRESDVQPFDCVVAKQREGRVGKIPLTFNKTFTRFEMREQPKI